MVNCAYPTFLSNARLSPATEKRLIGFQANASSLDQSELDEAEALHLDPIEDWARDMANLHKLHGIKILGGCCGTGCQHLNSLVNACK